MTEVIAIVSLFNLIQEGVFQATRCLLASLGFWLIYSTTRYFHFSHGFTMALGAYCAFVAITFAGVPLLLAILASILICSLLGFAFKRFLYTPIKSRGGSKLVLLLMAIAVDIAGRNLLAAIFGDTRKRFRTEFGAEAPFSFAGYALTGTQWIMILVTAALTICISYLYSGTSLGLKLRAIADDPELAKAHGVNIWFITSGVFVVGSGLAGLAGVLYGLDVDVTPTLGLEPLIIAAAAVVLAGRESVLKLVVACTALAVAQVAVIWWIGSAWREAIALVLLLMVLVVRPGEILKDLINRRRVLQSISRA